MWEPDEGVEDDGHERGIEGELETVLHDREDQTRPASHLRHLHTMKGLWVGYSLGNSAVVGNSDVFRHADWYPHRVERRGFEWDKKQNGLGS